MLFLRNIQFALFFQSFSILALTLILSINCHQDFLHLPWIMSPPTGKWKYICFSQKSMSHMPWGWVLYCITISDFYTASLILLIFLTTPIYMIFKVFWNDTKWVPSKKRHFLPAISTLLSVENFKCWHLRAETCT